jgi:hypothetical protein
VRKTRGLEAGKRYRAKLAQAEADALEHSLPHGAAAAVKRPGFRADEAPLVYLRLRGSQGRHRGHVRIAPRRAPPGRLADPGGIPGHREGGRCDRDRHSQMVARRARASVLPST